MARQNMFISAFLIIALQFLLCKSEKCYEHKLWKCIMDNRGANADCFYNDKIVKCIHNLQGCQFQTQFLAEQLVKQTKAVKNNCKGLPDGDCFMYQFGRCLLPVTGSRYGSMQDASCERIKTHGDVATQCLTNLNTKCQSTILTQRLDGELAVLETRRKQCGLSQ